MKRDRNEERLDNKKIMKDQKDENKDEWRFKQRLIG